MAGDDPDADIRGAQAAGLRAIHVCRASTPVPCSADAVVVTLAEIPDVARGLLGATVRREGGHAA
jgi:hypothetical protein